MSLQAAVLAIVSSPQWAFVYNLILLLAIQAALGIAYGDWRRTRRPAARRMALFLTVILLLRLIPLLIAALSTTNASQIAAIFPVLERLLNALSILLLAGACIVTRHAGDARPALLLWAGIALIIAVGVGMSILWLQALAVNPQLTYTQTWHRLVWAGVQALISLAAIVMAARNPTLGRRGGILMTAFLLAAIAQVLETAAPLTAASAPGWERLASLLVYPLIAIFAYQTSIDALQTLSPQGVRAVTASRAKGYDAPDLLLDVLFGSARTDMPGERDALWPADYDDAAIEIARRYAGPITRALGADVGAVALVEKEPGDRIRLIGRYNPRRPDLPIDAEPTSEGLVFPLDEQLAIQRALRRQELILTSGSDYTLQIKSLFAALGSAETGPLMVQPLIYEGRSIGAMITGNCYRKQGFSPAAMQLSQELAGLLAFLLGAPESMRELKSSLQERERVFRARENEWEERLETLDSELQREQESARLFAQRLADLERESKQKQTENERVQRRMSILEEEVKRSQQETEALTRKLDALARTKVDLEDEITGYRAQIYELERLLSERD